MLLYLTIVMTAIVAQMMMLVGLKIQANAAAAKATYSLHCGMSADGVGGASPVAELPLVKSEACDDASSCLPSRKSLSLFVDQYWFYRHQHQVNSTQETAHRLKR